MKDVKIIMLCEIEGKDILAIFRNFSENYPEVLVSWNNVRFKKGKSYKFKWWGTVNDECVDDIIRLTHHAEAIYKNTSAQYVHVEVCVDGEWYGN